MRLIKPEMSYTKGIRHEYLKVTRCSGKATKIKKRP